MAVEAEDFLEAERLSRAIKVLGPKEACLRPPDCFHSGSPDDAAAFFFEHGFVCLAIAMLATS